MEFFNLASGIGGLLSDSTAARWLSTVFSVCLYFFEQGLSQFPLPCGLSDLLCTSRMMFSSSVCMLTFILRPATGCAWDVWFAIAPGPPSPRNVCPNCPMAGSFTVWNVHGVTGPARWFSSGRISWPNWQS